MPRGIYMGHRSAPHNSPVVACFSTLLFHCLWPTFLELGINSSILFTASAMSMLHRQSDCIIPLQARSSNGKDIVMVVSRITTTPWRREV
ncbi:hypothetical protein BDW68DRAFT_121371 [Aspergillus falconensis]